MSAHRTTSYERFGAWKIAQMQSHRRTCITCGKVFTPIEPGQCECARCLYDAELRKIEAEESRI